VLRLRPLAFATFLVWRLWIGACGFWRIRQLPFSSSIWRSFAVSIECYGIKRSEIFIGGFVVKANGGA